MVMMRLIRLCRWFEGGSDGNGKYGGLEDFNSIHHNFVVEYCFSVITLKSFFHIVTLVCIKQFG